jgi:hypothetical protein
MNPESRDSGFTLRAPRNDSMLRCEKFLRRLVPASVHGNKIAARRPKMEQAMDPLPTANPELTQFLPPVAGNLRGLCP